MNKIFAVLKREYLAAVRKKMFIIMTVLFPAIMGVVFFVPMMLMSRSLSGKKVAVVDGTGRLHEAFSKQLQPEVQDPREAMSGKRSSQLPQAIDVDYVDAHGAADLTPSTNRSLDKLRDDAKGHHVYDAVLVVPQDAFTNAKTKLTFYSRAATDIMTQQRLSSVTNDAIQRQRMTASGLSPALIESVMATLPVEGIQLSRAGEKKKTSVA